MKKKRAPEQGSDESLRLYQERQHRIGQLKEEASETRMRLVVKLLEAAEELMPQALEQAAKGKPALLRILGRNTRMIR